MSLVVDSPASAPRSFVPHDCVEDVAALRGMLAMLRRQTRRWIWVESLALACLAAAAFFWGSLAVDWSLELPRGPRAVLLAAAIAGLALLLQRKLVSRLAADLCDASLAVVVERAHPSFRDSLSTAVELAGQPGEDLNQQLLGRTAAEATAHLGEVRFGRIFRHRRLAWLAFAAALAVASIASLAVARPAIAGLWVRRMPLLGNDPWPRRVRIEIDDFPGGVRKVARGSDVDMHVHVQAAGRLPEVVDLKWRGNRADGLRRTTTGGLRGNWHTDRMGGRGGITQGGQAFGHTLKAVSESLDVEVRAGDARLHSLRLVVLDPPALEKILITLTLPDYLGGGQRVSPPSRIVQIPRGSAVEIACTSTKPLSAATMVAIESAGSAGDSGGPLPAEQVLATLPLRAESEGAVSATALMADSPRVIVGRIAALSTDCTVVVRFTDTEGLVNREPVTFVLAAVPDESPQLSMRLRGISTAVTPRARVPLVGTISDDHGLAAAAVRLKVADGAETSVPVARVRAGDAVLELPAEAAEIVALEPLGLRPGQKLELAVTATDACTLAGGPNAAVSDAWSLDVVTTEALVAMLEAREIILRRRYESCVADLTQARDRLAAPPAARGEGEGEDATADGGDRAGLAAGLGEAASRAAGETAELAEAFRGIRLEFDNNQLLSPELETRLIAQIADPLAALAAQDLPTLGAACRAATGREDLVRDADLVLARMRAVLDKMMELESFNEVLDLLRGMIRTQEQIRTDTLEQQKRRAREALERP